MPEFTRAFTGRIMSLARTHALITEDEAQVASFEELLRAELGLIGKAAASRSTVPTSGCLRIWRCRQHGPPRVDHQRAAARRPGPPGRTGDGDMECRGWTAGPSLAGSGTSTTGRRRAFRPGRGSACGCSTRSWRRRRRRKLASSPTRRPADQRSHSAHAELSRRVRAVSCAGTRRVEGMPQTAGDKGGAGLEGPDPTQGRFKCRPNDAAEGFEADVASSMVHGL